MPSPSRSPSPEGGEEDEEAESFFQTWQAQRGPSPDGSPVSAVEEEITEGFLQHHCGVDDLAEVQLLELRVDSARQSLDALGRHLPNLQELRLTDSSILCVRELGAALSNLKVLWLGRCGLQELDGITVMDLLQEIYLPFNHVEDVSMLKWLEDLEVLDLEGNAITGVADVEELRGCGRLRELTLRGNPCCHQISRDLVLDWMPSLDILDDAYRESPEEEQASHSKGEDVTEDEQFLDHYVAAELELYLDLYLRDEGSTNAMDAAAHPLVTEFLRCYESLLAAASSLFREEPSEEELVLERVKRPRQPTKASTSGKAPSAGPFMAATHNAGFDFHFPRRGTAAGEVAAEAVPGEAASELTRGESLAGNPLAALRHRRGLLISGAAVPPLEVDLGIRELLRRHEFQHR